MILDTSAIMSILLGEPDREDFFNLIASADSRYISVLSVVEATMVLEGGRRNTAGGQELDRFMRSQSIIPIGITVPQMEVARETWRAYGKGNHPAGLNLGDCFSYALSEVSGEPLLFKGKDLAQTNVIAAS